MTQVWDPNVGRSFSYLAGGATATATCVDTVTQTVTNTATVTFADGYTLSSYGSLSYTGASTATATATVTRQLPAELDVSSCDALWYSSDERNGKGSSDGTIGVLNTTTGAPTPVVNIGAVTQDTYGSAAVAMDPSHPDRVYFVAREGSLTADKGRGLFVYDRVQKPAAATLVTSVVPDNGSAVARLGMDPAGHLWTIGSSGAVFELDPTPAAGPPTWQSRGRLTLPGSLGLTPSDLQSGDLTFDGNGTLYFISANVNAKSRVSYLFTLTRAELLDGSPAAKLAGRMGGSLPLNGLAFTQDGTAYASESGALHRVNILTGEPTLIGSTLPQLTADLTSCALPKPLLQVTKTVTPLGPLRAGADLTYTVTVENLGALAATNTTLSDVPEGAAVTSVRLNGGADLGASYLETTRLVNSPGDLPGVVGPGKSVTATITAKLTPGRTQVCNQSRTTYEGHADAQGRPATLLSDDPTQPGGVDKTCNPVYDPAIAVVKNASPDVLDSDGSATDVTYSFEVRNAGNEPLRSVAVVDPQCPPTYQGGDTNRDGILSGAEVWNYVCSTSLPGTGVAGTGTAVRNTVTVTGTGTETRAQVDGSDSFLVTPPGLTFRKESSTRGAPVRPGDEITYTLTARNTTYPATDLTHVTVTDSLPAGVTYVPGSSSKTPPDGETTPAGTPPELVTAADDVTLRPGQTLRVTFRVRVGATAGGGATRIENAATAKSDQSSVVEDVVADTVRRPIVDVRKFAGTLSGPDADGRYTVSYTVRVVNSGPGDAVYGPITDSLAFAPNLAPVSARWSGPTGDVERSGSLTSPTGSFTLTGASTPLRDDETHTYDVAVVFTHVGTDPAPLCAGPGTGTHNSVSLPAGHENGPTTDNAACLDPIDAFEVKKRAAGGASGGAGASVTATVPQGSNDVQVEAEYVVTVTNRGLRAARHPEITDAVDVPAGFAVSRITVNGVALDLDSAGGRFVIPAGEADLPIRGSADYRVVVVARTTTPAEVDWAAAGSCTAVEEDSPPGGIDNRVTSVDDGDDTNNQACVPFTPPTAPITLLKTGLDCDAGTPQCRLAGASFTLYASDPRAGGAPVTDGFTVDPDEASRFTSTELTYYTPYWIVERTAPPGHTLLPQPIRLSLTTGGLELAEPASGLARVAPAGSTTLQVLDPTPARLPATGGDGYWPFLRIGALLVALGAAGALVDRSRRLPRHRDV